MSEGMTHTYDGRPMAQEPPHGAAVIVHRRGERGLELLILRRAHTGPASDAPPDDGDWTWTPPSGARLPGEPVGLCAQRELLEETGLVLPLRLTAAGSPHWRVFTAIARPDARVVLDDEHDAYEWVGLDEALRRCRPLLVADQIRVAMTP